MFAAVGKSPLGEMSMVGHLAFDVICVFLVHIVYVPYVFHLERIQPKMYCTLTDSTQSALLTSYLFVYASYFRTLCGGSVDEKDGGRPSCRLCYAIS